VSGYRRLDHHSRWHQKPAGMQGPHADGESPGRWEQRRGRAGRHLGQSSAETRLRGVCGELFGASVG
jgi:hypothetical protein